MADAAEFQRKLSALMSKYPKSITIIRDESDVARLNFGKLSKDLTKVFHNADADNLLSHVSKCLLEGNCVALQSAGSDNMFVHVGKGLF
jgi:hypothetical protein